MENYKILPKIYDQSLLAKYYSMADVFVICSKRENFPTTCIEAQCCGTPVVGFDAGGTKETSLYGPSDFVPYGDVDSLAVKLKEMLNRDTSDLVERAREAYSKETMTREYLREYDCGGRKERILLLDVNCKGSSTGKIVYDLYSNIRKDGRVAAICYGRGPLVEGEKIFKFGLDWETYLHAGLARLTGYNGCFSYFSTKRLIKYIEAFNPDLIHIHELHAYFVNIRQLLEYLKSRGIPVVWTFHCEYMYTGKCGYAYECSRFQDSCGQCPRLNEYPKSLVFDNTSGMLKNKKKLLSDLDFTIVTPSEWLANRVNLSFLYNKEIKVIHNGIDLDIFHPISDNSLRNELGIRTDEKVVLAVAPNIMDERKGGKLVLDLANKMKQENIRFVLVGEN